MSTDRATPSSPLRRAAVRILGASGVLIIAALAGGVAAKADGFKVAMILPGSINDQSWNASGHGAIAKLGAKGVEAAFSENVAPADHIETMKDYARRGFNPVIGHSGRFLSAAQRVSPEFEKTTFIIGSGAAGAGKNVTSIDYDNAQMGYLMGVLAARMSKSGKIGSVNGLEGLPNIVQQVGGFRQGVKSVSPKAEVKVIYIKDMEDAAMAKEAALALIAGGADFVFGKLNAGHNGIIQAAKEKNVFSSGRSLGHVDAAPKNVLTAIVEKWSDMYVAAALEAQGGKLKPELITYGYNSPAGSGAELQYAKDKPYNPMVPAEVVAELEAIKKKFASGELKLTVSRDDARGGI
jgi:basic membrane protein A